MLNVPKSRKRGIHSTHRAANSSGWHDTFWPSMGWQAFFLYILLKLRRSASDPHRVALGMSIGMWANFLPLPGLGSALSIGLAWLLRGNMMSAFIGQLFGNAWTMPIIWWACYKVGLLVFPLDASAVGFKMLLANIDNTEFLLENWRQLASSVMLPVAVGGQMIGIPMAIISYWLTHWEVRRFWEKRRAANAAKQRA